MKINFFDEQYFSADEIWKMISSVFSNISGLDGFTKTEFPWRCEGRTFLIGVGDSNSAFAKVGKYVGNLNGKDFYSAFITTTDSVIQSWKKGTFKFEDLINELMAPPKNDFGKRLNCLKPGKPGNPDWAQRHRFMCD